MPYCRILRDSRGHEYFALIHQSTARRGRVEQQLLYWFRTPPNLKIGRRAFDDDTARTIEAQYPDVRFDWEALRATPPPPAVEPWRERRRAERAARLLREGTGEDTDGLPDAAGPPTSAGSPPVEAPVNGSAAEVVVAAPTEPRAAETAAPSSPLRRRQRRRGRRGGAYQGARPASGPTETASSSSSNEEPANGD
jgi:hypothetical protein